MMLATFMVDLHTLFNQTWIIPHRYIQVFVSKVILGPINCINCTCNSYGMVENKTRIKMNSLDQILHYALEKCIDLWDAETLTCSGRCSKLGHSWTWPQSFHVALKISSSASLMTPVLCHLPMTISNITSFPLSALKVKSFWVSLILLLDF